MHSPIASSATAWIAPPFVARAVATARSPSAGLPIASERATVSGRTGRTGSPSSNAVATGEQPSAWPPISRGAAPSTSPSSSSSRERLVQLRVERAGGDRRDDHVGRLPAELLGDLVRERLRALGVVAAQADVDEAPVELERELDRQPVAVVVACRRRRRASRRTRRSRSASPARGRPGRRRRPRDPPRRRARRPRSARLPVEEQASVVSPSSCALAVATATTRSLNECVGFAVSSFSQSSPTPSCLGEPVGARTSGVRPGASRCSAGGVDREAGRRSARSTAGRPRSPRG